MMPMCKFIKIFFSRSIARFNNFGIRCQPALQLYRQEIKVSFIHIKFMCLFVNPPLHEWSIGRCETQHGPIMSLC